jgi:hypothetical protein
MVHWYLGAPVVPGPRRSATGIHGWWRPQVGPTHRRTFGTFAGARTLLNVLHNDNSLDHFIAAAEGLKVTAVRSSVRAHGRQGRENRRRGLRSSR